MLVDGYSSGEYLYTDSSDLKTWGPRHELPGGLSGFIRRGTVLARATAPK